MVKQITLMELYLIETLRTNGVSDEEIINKVNSRNVESFKPYDDQFDFTQLYSLAEEGMLEDVLKDGYQIKYVTFTGLVNVLRLKFNKHEHQDYEVDNYTISGLQMNESDLITLKQMVSTNWNIETTSKGISITPTAKPFST